MLTRRHFLERAAALGATATALPILGCADSAPTPDDSATDTGSGDTSAPDDGLPTDPYDGPQGPETTFEHGVASADPLADAVLVWTRISAGDLGDGPHQVFLEVSTSPGFETRLAAATYEATAAADHTVTVDLTDLEPATTYHYRFSALGRTSPIGRTRTAAAGATERVRLGLCSCSNYAWGYFHAYAHLAARSDLDAVVHLGDYTYEYANLGSGRTYGTFRELEPDFETVTLDQYRQRYAHYRKDPDLAELHRQHPVIVMWDDHEFANDPIIGGADNHQDDEGDWDDRVAAALQAHREWVPSRMRDTNVLYRTLDQGDLVRLVMLDRQRRLLWPEEGDDHYLGTTQAAWLDGEIANTTQPWLVLGQGTSFGSRDANGVTKSSWDSDSREQVFQAIEDAGIDNLVVLTGDIHKFEALDTVRDPNTYDPDTGVGSGGVEVAVGSISSPGGTSSFDDVPQFFWSQGAERGYTVLDLTRERAQLDMFGFSDLLKTAEERPAERFLKGWATTSGSRHLVEVDAPAPSREDAPPLAP